MGSRSLGVAGAIVATVAAFLVIVVAGCSAPPEARPRQITATPAPTNPDSATAANQIPDKLPLMTLTPQAPVMPTLPQLEAAFPAVGHRPFNEAGFDAVVLPFLFVSKNEAGDPAEALAFSFLLSNSLDWAPGSYCGRHSFFVFKRQRSLMLALSKEYKDEYIRTAIKYWAATHAIGGTVVADKDGYTGTLLIYTTQGVLHKKEYALARDYFDLLGDMTADAMTLLDQAPGRELVRYLHRKRCQRESVIDLGRAAFLPERGAEEFGLYDKILKRDPGFADVRYWWANQKHWKDGDGQAYFEQIVLALDAYPVLALWDIYPNSPSPERYDRWLDQARNLAGPDNQNVLRSELDVALRNQQGEVGPLLDRIKKSISRYPNEYWLALDTANTMTTNLRFADADAAASLYLIALQSRYLPGNGKRWAPNLGLIQQMTKHGGRPDWAAALALDLADKCQRERGFEAERGEALRRAGDALTELGQFDQAAEAYVNSFPLLQDDWQKMLSLSGAGVAMALSGQRDRLERLSQKREELARKTNCLSIWKAYLDLLDGKKVEPEALLAEDPKDQFIEVQRQRIQLYGQVCYVQGKAQGRTELAKFLRTDPECRLSWVLFDAFDRRWPEKQSAAFYEALEWLHGQDPWVKQAVADFRRRTPQGETRSAKELLKNLADYPPVRWPAAQRSPERMKRDAAILNGAPPGAFAAAIRHRVEARDYATARELALRFHNLVAAGPINIATPMYANSLIYKVEAASTKPAAGP